MEELEVIELEDCLSENIDFGVIIFSVNIIYEFLEDIILSYNAC